MKAYAQDVDLKAEDLTKESQQKDQVIYEKEGKIKKAETDIIKKDAKISSRNGYLVGAGAIILVLAALVIKPWRWI